MDGGAWWAAVYGVAQSRTRLNRLSSSSSSSGSEVQNLPTGAGDPGYVSSISGYRRSPAEGNGNPLQYSCLGKSCGQKSPAGYRSWKSQRVRHNLATTTKHVESWNFLPLHQLLSKK